MVSEPGAEARGEWMGTEELLAKREGRGCSDRRGLSGAQHCDSEYVCVCVTVRHTLREGERPRVLCRVCA